MSVMVNGCRLLVNITILSTYIRYTICTNVNRFTVTCVTKAGRTLRVGGVHLEALHYKQQ